MQQWKSCWRSKIKKAVGGREKKKLLEVVKFLPRYENIVKIYISSPAQVNPSDLTLATKFVAMYLFIKVKGSRPMTYQYLTVDMIAIAKGWIH